MDFEQILAAFTDCVEKGDAERFGRLFTEDGVYVDGFYGAFTGRKAIADMLANHFHGAAKNFKWIMRRPVRVVSSSGRSLPPGATREPAPPRDVLRPR